MMPPTKNSRVNGSVGPARASKQPEGVVISDQFASLFESSDRAERYRAQLMDFIETHVYPAEPVDGGAIL
jgi:hypothetical protein